MSLFKYYSPKKYNFAAIAQHQLFFCRPSGLNDPYDTTVVNINAFPGFCKKLNIKDRMFRKSLDEHTICCFSKDDKPDNLHLWAFYALNYEGFSVEYDENILRNPFPSMIAPLPLLDVDYRDRPINLDGDDSFIIYETSNAGPRVPFREGSVMDCINEYILYGDNPMTDGLFLELHLQKQSAIWKIENECRLIVGNVILSNLNSIYRKYFRKVCGRGLLLTIPEKAIKSITVGYRTSDKNKRRLKKIASKLNVKLFQATPYVEDCNWTVRLDDISTKTKKP